MKILQSLLEMGYKDIEDEDSYAPVSTFDPTNPMMQRTLHAAKKKHNSILNASSDKERLRQAYLISRKDSSVRVKLDCGSGDSWKIVDFNSEGRIIVTTRQSPGMHTIYALFFRDEDFEFVKRERTSGAVFEYTFKAVKPPYAEEKIPNPTFDPSVGRRQSTSMKATAKKKREAKQPSPIIWR